MDFIITFSSSYLANIFWAFIVHKVLCNEENPETTAGPEHTFSTGGGLELWVPQSARPPAVPTATPFLVAAFFPNAFLFANFSSYKLIKAASSNP